MAGRLPGEVAANACNPHDYDHGQLVMQIDDEHDLFGDGGVVTVPTFGHTPGHRSLKVRLASGDVVLAADACCFRRTQLHLPQLVHDRAAMLDSLPLLRRRRPHPLQPRLRLLAATAPDAPRDRLGQSLPWRWLYKDGRKTLKGRNRGNQRVQYP